MSTVLIVGGGQGGLHLGIALRGTGHEVTVLTDRDAERIRTGAAYSTNFAVPLALERQRADGVLLPELAAPPITRLRISVAGPRVPALTCAGSLPEAGCSLDYRVSHSAWLETFVQRGGRLEVRRDGWSIEDIDAAAAGYDVVIVATGRVRTSRTSASGSDPGGLFDPWLDPFFRAQRRLSAVYVRGLPEPDEPEAASLTMCPGLGEVVEFPARTLDGPCRVVLVEALPGGPWDRNAAVADSAAAQLESVVAVLEQVTGRVGAYRGVELTDPGGRLVGEVTPRVSRAVGRLPSGRPVLALGDAAITTDPLAAQGGNQASIAASVYAEEINRHGGPFDARWMRTTWDRYWNSHGAAAVDLSTALVSSPLPRALLTTVATASQDQRVADELAAGFLDPTTARRFYRDPAANQPPAAWQILDKCGPMIP